MTITKETLSPRVYSRRRHFRTSDFIEVGRSPSQGAQFTSAVVEDFVMGRAPSNDFVHLGRLVPVFLAFIRSHNALEIGEIMLVTGVAQLLTAPIAVALE